MVKMTDKSSFKSKYNPLPRTFFSRKTVKVARDILGKNLVRIIRRRILVARIVEVEAYLGEHDPAAHASLGRTTRTEVLYGKPGHAYVFHLRGYNCLNAVAEPVGSPGCVLIRAAEPLEGLELMRKFRAERWTKKEIADRELANGPGKLCQALAIDMSLYGADMTSSDSPLQICRDTVKEKFKIRVSRRIGITKAAEWNLRFTIKGNKFLSKE